ncbi:NAD(P)H-hydrate dehydratase [Bosea sp. CS1GBMeth4]|uniref:NAD(P)H-hydrate dehydratase n=1 Tax=Bosea sp. CS1GBMeth4 TaxID=1892849 RepID=UPI001FCE770A|nr:NAD(P)H-hydrate dehydratase [Bosea sp. CS1GBMeth4]
MTEETRTDLALLSVAEMAAADAFAIASGTPGIALMEQAGRAVADAVTRRARPGQRVLVLCGPGNNGGDGFVAGRILAERGCHVALALAGARAALSGDAALAAARWTGPIAAITDVDPAQHDLVVDALFGAGLGRPIAGDIAALVERVNASARPVVAVDVPSGVHGDTGLVDGPAVRADETVTFFRLKPGHLLHPGRALCGVVTLADIGIRPDIAFGVGRIAPSVFRNDPALWRSARPDHAPNVHKYGRGAVAVAAGGLAGVGAPRLGARAALRIGAGLATIICRPEALAAHAARGPDALMQMAAADAGAFAAALSARKIGALLIGPALGLDAEARSWVAAAVDGDWPCVFDADALTHIAADRAVLAGRLGPRAGPAVLTPHEGEFSRLVAGLAGYEAERGKLARARQAAQLTGAVVVLKGPDTVIAAPDGRAAVNATGSPALATAGAGDVLGGMVAGLLAQGTPAFEAACAAVWLHGRAGERLGLGLIADDLPEALPGLLAAFDR